MNTISVLIMDQKKNTVVVEMDGHLFRRLGINTENIHKHKSRRSLNEEITKFLSETQENT